VGVGCGGWALRWCRVWRRASGAERGLTGKTCFVCCLVCRVCVCLCMHMRACVCALLVECVCSAYKIYIYIYTLEYIDLHKYNNNSCNRIPMTIYNASLLPLPHMSSLLTLLSLLCPAIYAVSVHGTTCCFLCSTDGAQFHLLL
jgi:hypothetical protein